MLKVEGWRGCVRATLYDATRIRIYSENGQAEQCEQLTQGVILSDQLIVSHCVSNYILVRDESEQKGILTAFRIEVWGLKLST